MRPSNDGHGQSPLHPKAKLDLSFNPEERKGLTTPQAEELQRTVGFNELPTVKVSKLMLFFLQFTGTMPYMLEVAAIISAACQDWADLGIIVTMLICNGCLGFREELECLHSLVRLILSFFLSDDRWPHLLLTVLPNKPQPHPRSRSPYLAPHPAHPTRRSPGGIDEENGVQACNNA